MYALKTYIYSLPTISILFYLATIMFLVEWIKPVRILKQFFESK